MPRRRGDRLKQHGCVDGEQQQIGEVPFPSGGVAQGHRCHQLLGEHDLAGIADQGEGLVEQGPEGDVLRPATCSCCTARKLSDAKALVCDRGSQFTASFDEVFRTEGLKVLTTPVRTPVANSFAERWIGTLRRELLDRAIIWNQRQLHRLAVDDIDHYNRHRPHRALQQRAPVPSPPTQESITSPTADVIRLPRCDDLINEYKNAA